MDMNFRCMRSREKENRTSSSPFHRACARKGEEENKEKGERER